MTDGYITPTTPTEPRLNPDQSGFRNPDPTTPTDGGSPPLRGEPRNESGCRGSKCEPRKALSRPRASVGVSSPPQIDFDGIAGRADLVAIVTADLGAPDRSRRWLCPFHPDQHPSLGVFTGRDQTPRWKCLACGEKGNALDWLVRRDNLTLADAARRLDPSIPARADRRQPSSVPSKAPGVPVVKLPAPETSKHPAPAWHSPEWQQAVDAIVCRAEECLWSPAGRQALDWLMARGLADHTIRRFRLGFLPDWTQSQALDVLANHDGPRPIKAARGITIPWLAEGAWYSVRDGEPEGPRWCGCNVRRLMPRISDPWPRELKAKYMAVAGSSRGHGYPWPDEPMRGKPVLITEGEIDALLAFQAVGHLLNVVTVGGATQNPDPAALAFLDACPVWLLAVDHDEPGDKAARELRALSPHRVRRLYLPDGSKDIGEFFQRSGDPESWLKAEAQRLGLRRRPAPTGRASA